MFIIAGRQLWVSMAAGPPYLSVLSSCSTSCCLYAIVLHKAAFAIYNAATPNVYNKRGHPFF